MHGTGVGADDEDWVGGDESRHQGTMDHDRWEQEAVKATLNFLLRDGWGLGTTTKDFGWWILRGALFR